MTLLTRQEVINIWQEHSTHNDKFVCPDCRDILTLVSNWLECINPRCTNTEKYFLEEINK
jgi:hypothetical protein